MHEWWSVSNFEIALNIRLEVLKGRHILPLPKIRGERLCRLAPMIFFTLLSPLTRPSFAAPAIEKTVGCGKYLSLVVPKRAMTGESRLQSPQNHHLIAAPRPLSTIIEKAAGCGIYRSPVVPNQA
ncbi:hypothetical protein CVT25_007391 [Psilocybe cyanescens]|uniref:Uncharacterized protein n=1 Tax=Psilocybe cyanescens TaxID=93625 RepID=A0A409XJF2_PSICY|nr:hypothetical protein CVT25_007391 [Psilocybe cyanescens]